LRAFEGNAFRECFLEFFHSRHHKYKMATLALFKSPVPVKTKTNKKLKPLGRPTDYLSVVERMNGRAAMIGFSSALVDEITTGHSISTQFHEHVGISVVVASLAFLGIAASPKDGKSVL
jgi:hypothetical protein